MMEKHELRTWFAIFVMLHIITLLMMMLWTTRIYRAVHGWE